MCNSNLGLVCLENECSCNDSATFDGRMCVKKAGFEDSCDDENDCDESLECVNGICVCPSTQYFDSKSRSCSKWFLLIDSLLFYLQLFGLSWFQWGKRSSMRRASQLLLATARWIWSALLRKFANATKTRSTTEDHAVGWQDKHELSVRFPSQINWWLYYDWF